MPLQSSYRIEMEVFEGQNIRVYDKQVLKIFTLKTCDINFIRVVTVFRVDLLRSQQPWTSPPRKSSSRYYDRLSLRSKYVVVVVGKLQCI